MFFIPYALDETSEGNVVIRSLSADTDIIVLFMPRIDANKEIVFVKSNKNNVGKIFRLLDVGMGREESLALLSFHEIIGIDYSSLFFRKGKHMCWRVLVNNHMYKTVFNDFAFHWNNAEELLNIIEEFGW